MRHGARRVASVVAVVCACAVSASVSASAAPWPTTIARVERGASSPDVGLRRQAARALRDLPPSSVRRVLPALLKDPDAEVRVGAGRAAIGIGFDAAGEAEVWLSDTDPAVRQVAAQMLGMGPVQASAVTALARTLSDPVPAVRLEAARALAGAPAEDGARVLQNHLDDAQEAFVLAVIDSLAILRSESAIVPLVGKVQDPRVNVRRAVVRALGEFRGSPRVVMPLGLALADSDSEVRQLAIESLVSARAASALAGLEERVRRDRDVDVQAIAVGGLLDLAESSPDAASVGRAVALVVECLGHDRQELRSEALDALAKHARLARAELRSCLTTASGEVVARCALGLAHDQVPENTALLVSAWRQGRLLAPELLTALGKLGGDQALLMVLELMEVDAAAVREQAIQVAGELLDARGGDGRAVEPVADALRRAKTPEQAGLLIELLGRTRSERAVKPILHYLAPETPKALRLNAVRALGYIRQATVPLEQVAQLLTDDDVATRTATVMALREGEWTGTAQLLLRLLAEAKLDEGESLALALWGPAKQLTSKADMVRFQSVLDGAPPRLRDALVEALGRVDWTVASGVWQGLGRTRDCGAASKVAEVLGAHAGAVDLLVELSRRSCPSVRANVAWALGYHGGSQVLPTLRQLMSDPDRTVSGNATASLGRVAARHDLGAEVAPALCEQVRAGTLGGGPAGAANALFALRRIGRRCGDGADERRLLASAKATAVRSQAALLLQAVPVAAGDVDAKALERCVRYDLDGEVAAACLKRDPETAPSPAAGSDAPLPRAVTILVSPATQTKPMPAGPFALLTEEDAYRFGWTDARGGVWMFTTDSDEVRLAQPVGTW